MPAKIYRVNLTEPERQLLRDLIRKGRAAARKQTHARVLLLGDESSPGGSKKDREIVDTLGVGLRTVERVRQRFVEEGLDSAINPKPRTAHRSKRLDGKAEAFLIAAACSPAPQGRTEWTLQLLADRLVECEMVDRVSKETVRKTLKKTKSSLG